MSLPESNAVTIAWLGTAVKRWSDLIEASSTEHNVDANLIALIMTVESGGEQTAKSPAGAQGLMQIMPRTAQGIAAARGIPVPDIWEPRHNIDFGAWFLADLCLKYKAAAKADGKPEYVDPVNGVCPPGYGGPVGDPNDGICVAPISAPQENDAQTVRNAAAAYNSGEGRAAKYLQGKATLETLPKETQRYVKIVGAGWDHRADATAPAEIAPFIFGGAPQPKQPPTPLSRTRPNFLFAAVLLVAGVVLRRCMRRT